MENNSDLNNLSIEELKEKINSLNQLIDNQRGEIENATKMLQEASEYNIKLAYCTRLFAEVHLTSEEKSTIAQEFDRALSNEQVERIYKKYYNQVKPDGAEIEEDTAWSPGFTRELDKYFFHHRGYNPFEMIDESIQAIRTQFMIEDEIGNVDSAHKIEELRERWEENRMLALKGIDEIVNITNEFLRK